MQLHERRQGQISTKQKKRVTWSRTRTLTVDVCSIAIAFLSQHGGYHAHSLDSHKVILGLSLTLGAHAQRGLQYSVCLSVRPKPRLLGLCNSLEATPIDR